jgi:prophage regulatory protein
MEQGESAMALTDITIRKTMASTSLLRLPEVKRRTGLARSTIYLRIRRGEFSSSINLGGRAVAWLESEIDEWIRDRVKASRVKDD